MLSESALLLIKIAAASNNSKIIQVKHCFLSNVGCIHLSFRTFFICPKTTYSFGVIVSIPLFREDLLFAYKT